MDGVGGGFVITLLILTFVRPLWLPNRHVFLTTSGPGKAVSPEQQAALGTIVLVPWSGLDLPFLQTFKLLQSGSSIGVSMKCRDLHKVGT